MKYKLPQSYYDTIARIKQIIFGKKEDPKKEDPKKEDPKKEKPSIAADE